MGHGPLRKAELGEDVPEAGNSNNRSYSRNVRQRTWWDREVGGLGFFSTSSRGQLLSNCALSLCVGRRDPVTSTAMMKMVNINLTKASVLMEMGARQGCCLHESATAGQRCENLIASMTFFQ